MTINILKTFLAAMVTIVIISCAPMPGGSLHKNLRNETPISEVRNINIEVDLIKTSTKCNNLVWKDNPHQVVLNCLLNGCFVMACANVKWNDKGEVEQCNIYSSFDNAWIIEHELEHCKGIADKWY